MPAMAARHNNIREPARDTVAQAFRVASGIEVGGCGEEDYADRLEEAGEVVQEPSDETKRRNCRHRYEQPY